MPFLHCRLIIILLSISVLTLTLAKVCPHTRLIIIYPNILYTKYLLSSIAFFLFSSLLLFSNSCFFYSHLLYPPPFFINSLLFFFFLYFSSSLCLFFFHLFQIYLAPIYHSHCYHLISNLFKKSLLQTKKIFFLLSIITSSKLSFLQKSNLFSCYSLLPAVS